MDLINVSTNDAYDLQIFINKYTIALFLLGYFIYTIYIMCINKSITGKSFEIDGAEIGLRDQKIKLKPNYEDAQIAYKLWVELSTRKIGIPIDFENDVIFDIYNSWYEFFKITRELIKTIPISKIKKHDSTATLVNIAIDVLNEGLRPHLTLWQAKYRRWYLIESKKEETSSISPQELQRRFPEYDLLIRDMKDVNQKLIIYRERLKEIAFNK